LAAAMFLRAESELARAIAASNAEHAAQNEKCEKSADKIKCLNSESFSAAREKIYDRLDELLESGYQNAAESSEADAAAAYFADLTGFEYLGTRTSEEISENVAAICESSPQLFDRALKKLTPKERAKFKEWFMGNIKSRSEKFCKIYE
jgi:hypothetical protein